MWHLIYGLPQWWSGETLPGVVVSQRPVMPFVHMGPIIAPKVIFTPRGY